MCLDTVTKVTRLKENLVCYGTALPMVDWKRKTLYMPECSRRHGIAYNSARLHTTEQCVLETQMTGYHLPEKYMCGFHRFLERRSAIRWGNIGSLLDIGQYRMPVILKFIIPKGTKVTFGLQMNMKVVVTPTIIYSRKKSGTKHWA